MAAAPTNPQFEEMLERFDPSVRELAHATRDLIFDVLPGVVEVVWDRQGTAGYGTGPKKMSEHFCYIALHPHHLNLGFNYGSELADPKHLLEGPGKLLRHIKIHAVTDLENPALRDLLRTATTHRVPPLPAS
jgi:hypothetical protein